MKRLVMLILLGIMVFQEKSVAVETEMYGDFSALTFWVKPKRFDKDSAGEVPDDTTVFPWTYKTVYASDSVDLVLNDWLPSGKFGVNFKMAQFGACIEFGVGKNAFDAKMVGSQTTRYLFQKYGYFVTANKWYADWSINDYFTLLVGQDYTPANFFSSNRMVGPKIGYANMGCLYIGPRPMFQLGISTEENIVEAKFAVVKADTQTIVVRHHAVAKYVNEVTVPKLEGSVQFNKDFSELFGLRVNAVGGYQNYITFKYPTLEMINPKKEDNSIDVTSYLVGGELSVRVWQVSLLYSMFHGQNLGPYGIKIGEPHTWWRVDDFKYAKVYYPNQALDTIIEDPVTFEYDTTWSNHNSKVTEMSLILNFKINDYITLEGGFQEMFGEHGYKEFNDLWLDRSNYSWYAQSVFTMLENMNLTLEGGYTKFGKFKGFGELYYWGLGIGITY